MVVPCKYVIMSDESGPVVRLALTPNADDYPVLAGFTAARRLALRNAQLVAVVNSHIAQVQDSGRRLVAVSDAERQKIERDLHDGAQQRLVSAAFQLKVCQVAHWPSGGSPPVGHGGPAIAGRPGSAPGHRPWHVSHGTDRRGSLGRPRRNRRHGRTPATLSADLQIDAGLIGGDVAMAAFATVDAALHAVVDPSPPLAPTCPSDGQKAP